MKYLTKKLFVGLSIFSLSLLTASYALADTSKTKPATPSTPAASSTNSSSSQASQDQQEPQLTASQLQAGALQTFLAMFNNVQRLNYTSYFVLQKSNSLEGYMFANFYQNGQRSSILRKQEGEPFVDVLKNGIVSNKLFSISSNYITDVLPAIYNANINQIKDNYSFDYAGKNRIANRPVYVYDITNKYSNLFTYQVSLDAETQLPLKIVLIERDLINRTYLILNTWIVEYLDLSFNKPVYQEVNDYPINKNLHFANQINYDVVDKINKILHIPYLPAGFKLQSTQKVQLYGSGLINTNANNPGKPEDYYAATYSDGLFSFNIYVSSDPIQGKDQYYFRDGDLSLYAENYANRKIIVVGQIPLLLAKGIVNSIQIYKNLKEFYDDKHPEGYGQQLTIQ